MAEYRLSNVAKDDLIRIHQFGTYKFGENQADIYIERLFQHFDIIAERPLAFESVEYIKESYRRCACGSDSIFYKFNNEVVEIMAIIGRQDIKEIIK